MHADRSGVYVITLATPFIRIDRRSSKLLDRLLWAGLCVAVMTAGLFVYLQLLRSPAGGQFWPILILLCSLGFAAATLARAANRRRKGLRPADVFGPERSTAWAWRTTRPWR